MKNTSIQQTADKIIKIMQDAGLDYDQMLEVLALAKQKIKYYQSQNKKQNESLHRWQGDRNRSPCKN